MSTDVPYFGVDFGTTNSSMAWYNPETGRAEIILSAEGEPKTPSLIYFSEEEGEILVGKPVEDQVELAEDTDDPKEREEIGQRLLKSIKRNLLTPPVIPVPGRKPVRPVEAVAQILKKLKADAEGGHFYEEIEQVVITCPAIFGPKEREVLLEAAAIGGFGRAELLEEPTAAAMAFSRLGRKVGKAVLIYDLGAGTFDLSVVARDEEGSFYVPMEPEGDDAFGGDDLDLALYRHCDGIARGQLRRPISLTGEPDLAFLRQCRARKENLSSSTKSRFSSYLPSEQGSPERFRHEIDRETFEGLIQDRIEGTVRKTLRLIEQAKDRGHEVETVVLIGGSSQVPLVKRLLTEALPMEPRAFSEKDYAVALGAAYHAYELWNPASLPKPKPEPKAEYEPQRERVAGEIVVNPGDPLESAAREAPAGATLRLKAGEHRLSQPLEIDKPLSLIGEGMKNTRVLCDGEAYVVKLVDEGPFVLHDLSFEHLGSRWANVVEVASWEIEIRRCRFTGGVWDEAGKRGGDGLYSGIVSSWIAGIGLVNTHKIQTRGLVANCELVQNGLHGIEIGSESAQLTLEANTCQQNKMNGIVYSGSAAATAHQNTCSANGLHGIGVAEQAQPTLEANTCSANGLQGIAVTDQAQPTLKANTCEDNKECGITYARSATGTARHNTCSANEKAGIAIMGQTQPTIATNTCSANEWGGILVTDQAQPTLEGNTCQENKQFGIFYAGDAAGTAHQNTCSANEYSGILVRDQAQPTLEANTCQGNKQSGVVYFTSAAGVARSNTCSANGLEGISVDEQAQPTLEANTCKENKEFGIAFFGDAAGTAHQNTCSANEYSGILVRDQAQPTLEANTCQENKESGIIYFGSAVGTARQNTCSANERNGISVNQQAQPTLEANTCQENKQDDIYVEATARPILKDYRYGSDRGSGEGSQREAEEQAAQARQREAAQDEPSRRDTSTWDKFADWIFLKK